MVLSACVDHSILMARSTHLIRFTVMVPSIILARSQLVVLFEHSVHLTHSSDLTPSVRMIHSPTMVPSGDVIHSSAMVQLCDFDSLSCYGAINAADSLYYCGSIWFSDSLTLKF